MSEPTIIIIVVAIYLLLDRLLGTFDNWLKAKAFNNHNNKDRIGFRNEDTKVE